jgi:hypothetical protein
MRSAVFDTRPVWRAIDPRGWKARRGRRRGGRGLWRLRIRLRPAYGWERQWARDERRRRAEAQRARPATNRAFAAFRHHIPGEGTMVVDLSRGPRRNRLTLEDRAELIAAMRSQPAHPGEHAARVVPLYPDREGPQWDPAAIPASLFEDEEDRREREARIAYNRRRREARAAGRAGR